MSHRITALILSFAAVAAVRAADAAPQPAAPSAPAGTIDALAFMAGCWEADGGGGKVTFHEMWMKPAGGVMIGGGRTLAGGRAIFTENLQIREEGGEVTYWARPQDAAKAVPFRLTRKSDGAVTFENPAHDFPTRILYERTSEGGLRARVEGPETAKEKRQEFDYRRVPCE